MYVVNEANQITNEFPTLYVDIYFSIRVPLYSLYGLVYVESTRKVIFLYFDGDFD